MIGLRSPIFLRDFAGFSFMKVHQISLPSAVVKQIQVNDTGWVYLPFEEFSEVGDLVAAWSSAASDGNCVHSQSLYVIREIDPSLASIRTVLNPLHDRVLVRFLSVLFPSEI